jgi:hypothetical protein|tara:strand:+ start:809 stop:1165 length:357 start_codon:yes stop_codon:yes gene_type:complete
MRFRSKRRHKYGAIATTVDGIRFASKKEANRYGFLKSLERANRVKNLELQPKFPCVVNGKKICTYIADFRYTDEDGSEVIEDVKGVETAVFKLKKKLVESLYPIEIQVVKSVRHLQQK